MRRLGRVKRNYILTIEYDSEALLPYQLRECEQTYIIEVRVRLLVESRCVFESIGKSMLVHMLLV